MIRTSVVIPVYFNRETLSKVVDDLRREWSADGRDAGSLEFILVDDGSEDDSWSAIREVRRRYPEMVTALRLTRNHGSQLAILAGASKAGGERVAMFSADGQEPPSLLPEMSREADRGNALVLGVRASRADDWRTRAAAGVFYWLIKALGVRRMPEGGFDAFLMDRALMRSILEIREPNVHLAVTIAWLGHPYVTVPYGRLQRSHGSSRWTFRKRFKFAIDAVAMVSYLPIRLISLFGVVLALLGFLYAAVALALQLSGGVPVQGWTSLLIVVLVIGGTQLVALGVIGEYLWRTLEVARSRPLWTVAEVEPRDSEVASKSSTPSVQEV